MTATLLASVLLGLTVGLAERCDPKETKPLQDHVWAVERAGHTFADLRHTTDPKKIAELIAGIDVLLLAGGVDVDPALYGRPNLQCGPLNRVRDDWEIALIREAVRQKKGIFGICRGCQILNVAFGGTMTQDVPTVYGTRVVHNGLTNHVVRIEADSRLAGLLGTNLVVNSWHHQCVERPASGFRIVAWSADGVPEAIEHETLPVVGCQFHPEISVWQGGTAQPVFRLFAQLERWLGPGLRPQKRGAAEK